jgi:hypothetical protein
MSSAKPTTFLCFDPRDNLQSLTDRSTWQPTGNAVLISATMLMSAQESSEQICWEKVAALADLCDLPDGEPMDALHPAPVPFATFAESNALLRKTLSRTHRPIAPHSRPARDANERSASSNRRTSAAMRSGRRSGSSSS